MFENRKDAGKQLAQALNEYKDIDVLVLAIPKGGAEVGYEVAKHLNAGFSILVARKLPFPYEPEAGFGAVAEDGSTFVFDDAMKWVKKDVVERIIEEQKREIERRIAVLRGGKPLPEIKNKIVILVDDGIAMGSTMRVAIQLCKKNGAKKIVVAVPVTGKRTAQELGQLVDEIVVLEQPVSFHAVAQVYTNWYDVSDKEVIKIMRNWHSHRN